jgi:DNA repair exonuclease SbcCD ATPase subunit
MAMLAQGQFAKFLTGDKKEREGILEQLTNTSHFTDYGVAIQSLWKKAKENQTTIQTQYDTEKPHTLNDEQVEQITKELTEAKGMFEKYGKDIEATEGKLKQVEAVLRNEKSLTEASQFKQELEVKMAGEEYKRSKSLFTDWDGTTAQRQQFSDLIKARQDEAKARQDLSQARETFSLLTADMADRQAKAKLQEDAIRQLEEQIGKQAHHEELFTKAGETDLKIGQYLDKIRKSGDLTINIKQEKDQKFII